MNLWDLIVRNVRLRALSSTLTALSVALGVMLVTGILLLQNQMEQHFLKPGKGYSVVVGSPGSALQLVLNSVYHMDKSPGLMPMRMWPELEQHDSVALAVPYAVGDSFHGYRVVATTDALFDRRFPHPSGEGEEKLAEGRGFVFDREALFDHLEELGATGLAGEDAAGDHDEDGDHEIEHEEHGDGEHEEHGDGEHDEHGDEEHEEHEEHEDEHEEHGDEHDEHEEHGDEHDEHGDEEHDEHGDEEHDEHRDEEHDEHEEHGDEHEDEHDEHGDEHDEHGDEHDEHGDEHDEHGDEHDEHGDEHDEHGHHHEGVREAVLGAEVARAMQIPIGATIEPTHGVEGAAAHEHEHTWKVVGILKPTGTPVDKVVFINLDSFFSIEEHMAGALIPGTQEAGLSTVLLFPRPGVHKAMLLSQLNRRTEITVADVSEQIRNLFTIVGSVDSLFLLVSILVVVLGVLSILVAIYNTMSERRREVAILRAIGARRGTVFSAIVGEAALLTLLGGVAGLVLAHLLVLASSARIEEVAGFSPDWLTVLPVELVVLGIVLVGGALAGVLPAWKAYRTDVAQNLRPLS